MIRCIELNLPKPSGLVSIYGFFSTAFDVMPSKFISFFDPILPAVFCYRVTKCYSDYDREDMKNCARIKENSIYRMCDEKIEDYESRMQVFRQQLSYKMIPSYLISPLSAPIEILEKFPPTYIICSNFDVNLDDNIEFAKNLRTLGVAVSLDVLKDISHGFFNFTQVKCKFV